MTARITTADIWAARQATKDPAAKAEKVRKGLEAYRDGPHNKRKPPPKPKYVATQTWHTPDGQPPREWSFVNTTCRMHEVTVSYFPEIGAALSDRATPVPGCAGTPQAALKVVALLLSKRGGK